MDEIDIENVDDINELEARLYAQIHHEATDQSSTRNGMQLEKEVQVNTIESVNNTGIDQQLQTTNRGFSKRYWTSGDHTTTKQFGKHEEQQSHQRFIRNPFKSPNAFQNCYFEVNERQRKAPHGKDSNAEEALLNTSSLQSNKKDAALLALSPDESKKTNKGRAKDELPVGKSNLKLNPIADWMERKKTQNNKRASNSNSKCSKNPSINVKQGPFCRQHEKLQKAKRIEEKRKKSKKAKNSSVLKSNEVIDLDSENESNSSDVIMIPNAPAPTYIVEDSGEEGDNVKAPITMEHEENALDSTDVQMSSTTTSFIKPHNISPQSVDGSEKRADNSSRCTSPCSIQSSDDFIGQTDRSRLLASTSVMADDEDLLVLTSDVNSLLEVPDKSKQRGDSICLESEKNSADASLKRVQKNNVNKYSLEFAAPTKSNPESRPRDYRVDPCQYKALDVYESESDITDSVYSKGAKKSTVIRQIDTSSDGVIDVGDLSHRTKRLRKRRASSSNKESDPNTENFASSSDNEEVDEDMEDDNKLLRTTIPFIAKGLAVDHYKSRKRSRTICSGSPNVHKRKSTANMKAASDHMSDTEFIETLNNLAQGQEGEKVNQSLEETEESDTEDIPTARDIAEKILAQENQIDEANKASGFDVALPNDVLKELDEVFESIDQLDRQDVDNDTVKISDSSDSDSEKHFTYKCLPEEKMQIIEYSPDTSKVHKTLEKSYAQNGSPIYNIVYCRGLSKAGGIGWNDEMRKFYNESWQGEHFILAKVLQKMNPEKRLWAICKEDRFSIRSNRRTNIKCNNCCEFGHTRFKCKRPRKPMICYMCGDSGHYEPRCPNTICLRCGNKTQVFTKSCNACSFQNRLTCPICKIRGHSLDYCPDKWRRYHSTTEVNSYPNSRIEYNPRKYCCICGLRGHISDNCRSSVRFLEYPAISSSVKSHEKSYTDVVMKAPLSSIPLNLMYKPCQEYKFNLADSNTPNKYYGRFLRAVGMDFLLQDRINTISTETVDTTAKRHKRLSARYEANPYLKAATSNQETFQSKEDAPNQVAEITESGSAGQEDAEQQPDDVIVVNIEDEDDNEVEVINCTVKEQRKQLRASSEICNAEEHGDDENFKSPLQVTSVPLVTPSLVIDSDSNYSFSEHFDVASSSATQKTALLPETPEIPLLVNNCLKRASCTQKPREMEVLPDFIPLINSTKDHNEQHDFNETPVNGISRRFVVAVSDDDDEIEQSGKNLSPLPELPCEAKIYLTHFHSKYLISPSGNAFLTKTARAYKLMARLDFTSVGHVLVIFGLPTNQNEFQRELLLKYRELEDEKNQKQLLSNLNVPKRTYVLIRFLRESITQLMSNLGNVNHLLKRLQFLERQQSKSGYKLAEKVRKSLNMILVGQAGLQDGTMHLDKLLLGLKKLLTDVSDDIAPIELRHEITDHYKVIFSAYRHDNYQELVDTYNKLISKNRIPPLNIDPVLLGHKVLDTSFSEEQKQKLDQARSQLSASIACSNSTHTNTNTNTKTLKRKNNEDTVSTSTLSNTSAPAIHKTKTAMTSSNVSQTERLDDSILSLNIKTNVTPNTTATSVKSIKTPANNTTSVKPKDSAPAACNKSKQSTNASKSPQTTMAPPAFATPERHSTISAKIKNVTDKWKNTYDNLLTQISCENPISYNAISYDKVRSSKLPSTFWSRESMRYLDNCIHVVNARPQIIEKLRRVQNKSKKGQLSYNDYLAVIKLHNALNGK